MKNGRLVSAAAAFSVAAGSFNAFPASAVEKSELLDVSGFVIRDENFVHLSKGTYLRDVSYLFDEQDKVPESPDNLNVGGDVLKATSKANWTPNQQMEYGAASFYMDLGANYVITAVALMRVSIPAAFRAIPPHPQIPMIPIFSGSTFGRFER
jgi:hypothetical protein